jgi:chromosome segregation ATPase
MYDSTTAQYSRELNEARIALEAKDREITQLNDRLKALEVIAERCSWLDGERLKWEAEIARLRKALEDAPHTTYCEALRRIDCCKRTCHCWKRTASLT